MGLLGRMRALRSLLQIRLGPGAAEFPREVKRIHLDFATKIYDGHGGARKVWRQYLPRLKFHNPTVSMTVNRTTDQAAPATMTVFFAPDQSNSTGTSSQERAETIDMKHKQESDILKELLQKTNAKVVEPTEEEREEIRQLAEQKKKSDEDRAQVKLKLDKQRHEERLLQQARGMGPPSSAAI